MPEPTRPEDEQDLATLLADLRGPAEPHELAREREYVAAFSAARASRTDTRPAPRRSMLAQLLAARSLAAAAAVVAVAGGGAAAYAGSLPGSLQAAAHRTIGAPAPAESHRPDTAGHGRPTTSPTETRAPRRPAGTGGPGGQGSGRPATVTPGPDATGSAAKGLCTAWEKGGLDADSTAYESLARAAGGAAGIAALCAAVPDPGPSVRPTGAPTDPPRGRPADPGRPDDAGGGKPSELPAGASPTAAGNSGRSGG